jgi:hypothetical protein
MPLEDAKFAIDALANSNFSVLYLTGGETGIYPHIVEAVEYGRQKGLITSLTSNDTIPAATLKQLRKAWIFSQYQLTTMMGHVGTKLNICRGFPAGNSNNQNRQSLRHKTVRHHLP